MFWYSVSMNIYLASGNLHKKKEFAFLMQPHSIIIPKDEGILFEPEETGNSFIENSLIKAEALWHIVKKPVIADDSGICVDILNGKPGIFSARYADGGENQKAALIAEVEQKIRETGVKNRSCRFVCAIVYYFGSGKFYAVQETLEGELVESIKKSSGTGGFGYDPVFYLRDYKKTVAELSEEEKNTISHRAKAAKKLKQFIV